jgi:hypothetical protein
MKREKRGGRGERGGESYLASCKLLVIFRTSALALSNCSDKIVAIPL